MIVLTGPNGFVGKSVHSALLAAGKPVRALGREGGDGLTQIGSMTQNTDWGPTFKDATCVVHLAARVHMLNDKACDPLAEFRHINVDATLRLARQAAQANVKRFVFVSSIRVSGEATIGGHRFHDEDTPHPVRRFMASLRANVPAIAAPRTSSMSATSRALPHRSTDLHRYLRQGGLRQALRPQGANHRGSGRRRF
jgi:nucleoside-diphosphate-sugar epimerase